MLPTLAAPVPFSQAAAGLRRLRRPKFGDLYTALANVQATVEHWRILREFDPQTWGETVVDGAQLLDPDHQEGISLAALEAVDQVAPLDTDEMELTGESADLWPATMGYQVSWDDWEYTLENLGDQASDVDAVWFFCECLNRGDGDGFQNCAEHWDWAIGYPRKAFSPDYRLDTKKMFRRLGKAGLDCFIDAWKIAFYSTGTIYYDFNPFDEGVIFSLPSFTLDGVRELKAEYEKALPIQARFREAQRLFNGRVEIPQKLLDIFNRSLVKIETPKIVKASTLAEIWGLAEQAGITPENTAMEVDDDEENDETDPYGVLDGHRPRARVRTDGRIDEEHLTDILTDGGPELGETLRQIHEIQRGIDEAGRRLEQTLGELGMGGRRYIPVNNDDPDNHGGQAIDPFYGPIGPDPEEDDGW